MSVKTWTIVRTFTYRGETFTDRETTTRPSDLTRPGVTIESTETLVPTVGMGATLHYVNLSTPHVIVKVTPTTITVRPVATDYSTRHGNAESWTADGDLSKPEGPSRVFRYSERTNRYANGSQTLSVGYAFHHDLTHP